MTFGEISILLTGDAEELAEQEMINSGYNIEADIYKAAHHGSDTSNSKEFLNKIKPQYIIISCKMGNTYGHPNKSSMDIFKELGAKIYRTDQSGSIVMTTNR